MNRSLILLGSCLALLALCACAGTTTPAGSVTPATHFTAVRDGGSLGPVLTTSDGGQIFGFDIDSNGNDGVLASAGSQISVQTFNETTGKITKTLGAITGKKSERATTTSPTASSPATSGSWIFKRLGYPARRPQKTCTTS